MRRFQGEMKTDYYLLLVLGTIAKSSSIDDGGTKSEFPFELNKLLRAGAAVPKVHPIKSTTQFEVILWILKRDEMYRDAEKAKGTFHLLPI